MAYSNPNLLPDASSTFETGAHNWTAGSNTTLSVVTGKFLDGAQSLQLTATAAGSVSATSPRVSGIASGTEYVARIPIRRNTTTAGQVATITITWWSALTGGSSLGTATASLTLTGAAAGWFYYNYPTVVGTAPASAVAATVAVTVTGLAAAEIVNTDLVYVGTAATHPGNVYGFNTQSMEQDVSGWKVDSGTLARGNWNLIAGQGYYSLELTTAAAGSQDIRTNAFIAVTPGKEYTSYVAVRTPSVATTWYMEFRFYDASNAQVGTVTQTAYSVPTNTAVYLGVTAKAPTGVNAATCKVFVRPQATAAGQIFVLEDAQFYVSANPAGNLLTYAEYSTEGTLPSWTADGGTVAMAYFTSVLTDGMFALQVTPNGTGAPVRCTLNRLVPVTAGTTYQVQATIFRHNTSAAQSVISSVRTRIDWYDASGNLFQADNPDQFYSAQQPATWWAQINSETRTAPVGAAFAKVGFEVEADNPLIDYFVVDNISLMQSVADYTLETSNDSGSITFTVNYVPPAGAATTNVTILRMDENGRASSMRDYGYTWDLAPNPGSAILVEDYEAPLGSRVWYSVQWSDGTGATRGQRILTQTVDAPVLPDGDYVWFKSPGVPALNTTVMMEAPPKWARAARSQRYDIVGRKNPLNRYDVRSGRTASITVLVWDPQANELFNSLLDSGAPALIQAMPGYGLDGNLYVSVGDVDVEPLDTDAREDGWRWTLVIGEIDRPDGGLQGSSGSTWQHVLDSYATWEDVFNTHGTWTDVLTKG